MRILAVDDEGPFRGLLEQALSDIGAEGCALSDPSRAMDRLRDDADYDLVLIDVSMPEIDGWELLQRLREVDATVPVAFLTGHSSYAYQLRAVALGADFYVKPPDYTRLVAWLDWLKRRHEAETPVRLGVLELHPLARRVVHGERTYELPRVEFDLHLALARRHPEPVDRAALMRDALGSDDETLSDTFERHMATLANEAERSGYRVEVEDGSYRLAGDW